MFPSAMDEFACRRAQEMREQATQERRVRRLAAAKRWERRAARATQRARLIRDTVC